MLLSNAALSTSIAKFCILEVYHWQALSNLRRFHQSTMEGVMNPREAGRFISETSKDVFVEDAGIQKVADMVRFGQTYYTLCKLKYHIICCEV